MRQIEAEEITDIVQKLCLEANYVLREDVLCALKDSISVEQSKTGREVLEQLVENARIAEEKSIPICQDTGFVTVFVEMGQEVSIVGGDLTKVIEQGVRQAYKEGYLRASVVSDPCFSRTNTQDNTPPLIYISITPGDRLRIVAMPKGGGSENASQLRMLGLANGVEGIKEFVVEVVRKTGANSCPPLILGLGIGGTFDSVGVLAKKALLRPINRRNPDARFACLEAELLTEVNETGIGPGGFGGSVTALSVNIETSSTHMACLPAALNLSCHALRSAEAIV